MWPMVEMQGRLANTIGSPFSFGVINGTPVPLSLVEVVPVGDATEVVLASDGYTTVCSTLALSEQFLRIALELDPMCLSIISTNRAVRPGWSSFDDRAYLRVAI